MKLLIEELSEPSLDQIVSIILTAEPSLRTVFLHGLGHKLSASAIRNIFSAVTLPDDARHFDRDLAHLLPAPGPLSAFILNPQRYGKYVRTLTIGEPLLYCPIDEQAITPTTGLFQLDEENVTESGSRCEQSDSRLFRPLDFQTLSEILLACPNLEQFIWKSPNPPPDGVCEVLAAQNTRLTNFTFVPIVGLLPPQNGSRAALPKWDAPSLSLLSTLPLSTLHISRLSQTGARAFGSLLVELGNYPSSLEDVAVDFLWLDDGLCQKLVDAGRRIRRLRVGTTGTKLQDSGVIRLLEGCDALEEFSLIETHGRLKHDLWSKVTDYPPFLTTFKVHISETGPHHSWTADHLQSIPWLPFENLTHISIMRIVQPFDEHIDDVATMKPIPKDVISKLRESKAMTVLECDWWSWRAEDIKAVLDSCTRIEILRIAFDAPFSKLLALTSPFASVPDLRKLSVCISPQYAPSPQSSPLSSSFKQLPPTPSASPLLSRLPLASEQTPPETEIVAPADPSLPPLREVRKFVKRVPKLAELEWYGRNARGSWLVSRPGGPTPKLSNNNLTVDFIPPPTLTQDLWERVRKEEEAIKWGWTPGSVEREGQVWTGDKADAWRVAAEKEKESTPPAGNGEKKFRARTSSSVSESLSISPIMPITPIAPSKKPSLAFTPTSPTKEEVLPRRMPSEPSLRKKNGHARTRSATTNNFNGNGSVGNGNSNSGASRGNEQNNTRRNRPSTSTGGGRGGGKQGGSGPGKGRRTSTAGEGRRVNKVATP